MKNISAPRWQQIEALLDQVLEVPPDRRAAFLQEACPDDDLRQQVEAMLDAGDQAHAFLEDSDSDHLVSMLQNLHAASEEAQTETREGQRIGAFLILDTLGRGGMGHVYRAARADDAFQQNVAIKVIRRGLDTDDILLRFRTERQILASLSHPNIAHLLDGGVTDDGLPYFVMEYIEGKPLLEYCDAHRLSVDERLALFQLVCGAVHYAHQNLIVHRDLKPSNILVTEDGVPKLLDFGIAKFLDPSGTSEPVPMTRTEMRVMTPEYASPEQVRGEPITTASDVYALGVLLYELLTGHRPYHLNHRSVAELERIICETDPALPSTAIRRVETREEPDDATAITLDDVSRARNTPSERLQRRLEGDLDTIVMMALRKEPEHRYQSAEHLLEDINRHLAGLPVSAQRPTVAYRTRKFIQRHRVGVVAAALLVMMLVTVAALAVRFAIVTSQQAERIAVEAAKSDQVKDFMIGLFQESDPQNARGEEVTAKELLARGAEEIDVELATQPEVQAEMLHAMGVVYRQLGSYDKARPMLERALAMRRSLYGQEHEDVAQSLFDLAWLVGDQGDYDQAEALTREALAMRQSLLGPDHPDVANTLNDLGTILAQKGALEEAEIHLRSALTLRREVLGNEHRMVAESLVNLAWVLHEEGSLEEAEPLYREALAIQRKAYGDDHPLVATNMSNLAALMYDRGQYVESQLLFREILALRRKLLGEDHPQVAETMNWLGRTLYQQGQYAEAEDLYRKALERHRTLLGSSHPSVGRDLYFLALLLHKQGNAAEAEQAFEEAVTIYRAVWPEGHPYTAAALSELGQVLLAQRRPAEAEPVLRKALDINERILGAEDARTAASQGALGTCLTTLSRYKEAEPLLLASYSFFTDDGTQAQQARQHLVALYSAWGKPDEAARYRSK